MTSFRPLEDTADNPSFVHILQLSDLHFGSDAVFEGDNKTALLSVLEQGIKHCCRERGNVDILAVTGDLIHGDSIWLSDFSSLAERVVSYLKKLATETLKISPETRLLIIPGNHDCKYRGIFKNAKFGKAFRKSIEAFNQHTFYPKMNLLVGCFDSNIAKKNLELATGFVDPQEINRLEDKLEKARGKSGVAGPYRVALVHHHPLPVSEAEGQDLKTRFQKFTGIKLADAPEYLMLRNAGTFLDRLIGHGYQLALHGHLHHNSSTRYVRGDTDMTRHETERWLQVISCGSTATPGITGDYAFNSVQIHKTGVVDCVSYYTHHNTLHATEKWNTRRLHTAPYSEVRQKLRARQQSLPGSDGLSIQLVR